MSSFLGTGIDHYRKTKNGFLLDTNIISHLINTKAPHAGIITFFEQVSENELFLSVITLGEIQKGIDLIQSPNRDSVLQRQASLTQRLIATAERFSDRIIHVDEKIARLWGTLQARAKKTGFQPSAMDSLIAASADARNLVVVTGDADFKLFRYLLCIHNPFEDATTPK